MTQVAEQLQVAFASMNRARLDLDRAIALGMPADDAASKHDRFAAMSEWALAYKHYRDCYMTACTIGLRNPA